MDVLLTFLSRDKQVLLYDGKTVRIKTVQDTETTAITEEDASIAQLKELLAYLTHQTGLLSERVEELTRTAKEAVAKKNRFAALAALRSKKLAESSLEKRFATASQLEEVAAKIEQAADNVQLVKVMESSGEALRSLHAQVGGAEHVEDVVDKLREQMAAADEVTTILAAASADGMVVDEAEIDDELEALEGEERRKEEEIARQKEAAEKSRREAELAKEAEETKKRLEAIARVPETTQQKEEQEPAGKDKQQQQQLEPALETAESMMSRMTLDEGERSAELQAAS
jgi:charged multivesicular body protein 7